MGKLYNQCEQLENNYKKKTSDAWGFEPLTSKILRFLVRMSFAIEGRENEDIGYTKNAVHPLKGRK